MALFMLILGDDPPLLHIAVQLADAYPDKVLAASNGHSGYVCVAAVVGGVVWWACTYLWNWWRRLRCSHGVRRGTLCEMCAAEEAAAIKQMRERAEAVVAEKQRRQRQLEAMKRQEAERLRQLSYLAQLSSVDFENVVLQLYRALGYTAEATKASGDNGVDGFLRSDGDLIVLQCKRFGDQSVGAPVLRDLLGATVREGASCGILVTTSTFTKQAREWAQGQMLELIDGQTLIKLIASVPEEQIVPPEFEAKAAALARCPKSCPACGSPVVQRTGRFGNFLGCNQYPHCRWTMNLSATVKRPRRRRRWCRG